MTCWLTHCLSANQVSEVNCYNSRRTTTNMWKCKWWSANRFDLLILKRYIPGRDFETRSNSAHLTSEHVGIPRGIPTKPKFSYFQGDRPPNIKTLREIESKLKITHVDAQPSGDMSAYYKLLGLVGGKTTETNKYTVRAVICQRYTQRPKGSEKHKNNTSDNHTGNSQCGDPAVSNIVLEGVDQQRRSQTIKFGEPSGNRETDLIQKDTTTRTPCNPLTASYQRQVIASGPLGHNVSSKHLYIFIPTGVTMVQSNGLFPLMRLHLFQTNAASANACINQNLDGATQTESAEGRRNPTSKDLTFSINSISKRATQVTKGWLATRYQTNNTHAKNQIQNKLFKVVLPKHKIPSTWPIRDHNLIYLSTCDHRSKLSELLLDSEWGTTLHQGQ